MSKRELSRYLDSLSKKELIEQIDELYKRLKEVREFYNFVFNPKEEKLVDEAKFKISKEYFPPAGRKPKKRRSVAHKHIKNFIKLGVNPDLIGDVMLYNVEVAVASNEFKPSNQDAFYKSILKSFEEAIDFLNEKGILKNFVNRINKILSEIEKQNWINHIAFEDYYEQHGNH